MSAFAAKEYLSKSLLDYMIHLELLPDIYNAEVPSKKVISPKNKMTVFCRKLSFYLVRVFITDLIKKY